ncbi:energy transducer TonB [Sphingosinicella sp. BN140058]|uniref:energy transducer TonB n=1 Tax=Sphingosinicella sp. BN140058 TaxID=1892855 RepID=UPI001010B028|nr:energy transducer TonB [Sphingosinicella sp. BN140058]QAY76949.1 energy transducer TonB [Sphingosinicella sp. BN140058]
MAQGAFLQPTKSNGTALTVVILLHATALTAVALSKMDVIRIKPDRTKIIRVAPEAIPPENPPPPTEKVVEPRTTPPITAPTPEIDLPPIFDAPVAEPTHIRDVDLTPTAGVSLPDLPQGAAMPPPPPLPKTVEPARAKANLASYVTDSDYPAAAIRAEEQGTTRFRLAVGADGKVASCTVTASSGSSALDAKTCSIMQKRARFTPARDTAGNPVGDTVSNAIRWILPE